MFNIKTIEQNIGKYSKQQLSRKIQVVGLKSKDLNQQIESLFKQISQLEAKNEILEYNLHSTTRDRVQDLDKITFDSAFKEYKSMEKEVTNYVNVYNHLLNQNQIIQKNYKLIEGNNVKGKQTIKAFENSMNQDVLRSEEVIGNLRNQYDREESKKQGLLASIDKNQRQLSSLLNFYQNIETDIENLQNQKNNKSKQNNITLLQINEIRQDSEIRHAKDHYKLEKSKQSIRDIQKDLFEMENELKYVNNQNQKLDIIKVEVQRRNP